MTIQLTLRKTIRWRQIGGVSPWISGLRWRQRDFEHAELLVTIARLMVAASGEY